MADATADLATVWDQIRDRLATSLSPQQNAMLNLTRPIGLFEDTAVLAAPNEFTQTVLESRMRRVLAEALSDTLGRDIRVAVQLEDTPADRAPAAEVREEVPTRRPWSAAGASRTEEDRDSSDDGRSAFGVRADAGRPLEWERDAIGSPAAEFAEPEERRGDGRNGHDGHVAAGRGARSAERDWGGTPFDEDGAAVLPFDLGGGEPAADRSSGDGGRGRRPEGSRAASRGSDAVPLFGDRRPPGQDPGLNPKYVFDSFVIGNSNRFA
ncbi:MAG TPA: chromosomal replication initiator DnaA, partial [Geodermatophilus sp.]|nr:chromosomal replication initiator DnaA [Geodermatophilus sp.]